jgi:hypothetical protein
MNRKISRFASSLSFNRARASAANYRIVGRPASAGILPMARIGSPVSPYWHPNLIDSLRAPLTRFRD